MEFCQTLRMNMKTDCVVVDGLKKLSVFMVDTHEHMVRINQQFLYLFKQVVFS